MPAVNVGCTLGLVPIQKINVRITCIDTINKYENNNYLFRYTKKMPRITCVSITEHLSEH